MAQSGAQSGTQTRSGLRLLGLMLGMGLLLDMSGAGAQTVKPSSALGTKTVKPTPAPAPKPSTTPPPQTAKPQTPKPSVTAVAPVNRPKLVVAKGPAKPATVTERVFAHLKSDLPVDPLAKIGRLPNGMTYVIYPNKTPPGAVSMRLRVEAGGINENPEDQGKAHFLEHMAFLGSANIAEGELIHILERHGLKFGADTNAFTSVTQTFYQLDLPRNDADSLSTAMLIMSDTAQALTLDPGAVDREREVVLSEMRTRDTPARRAYTARLKTIMAGQAYVDHEVIGTVESLKGLTPAKLKHFYQTYYRPERTTLIIVGDVDPVAMTAMITAKFGTWKASAPPPPAVDYGTYKPKGLTLASYVAPGLSPYLSLSWFKPYDEALETRAEVKERLMDNLITRIVLRRLGVINSRDAPYESVNFARESYTHGASGLTVDMQPKSGQQTYAVTRTYEILRQFAAHGDTGIYQVDFDDAVDSLNLAFKRSASTQDTRNNNAIASNILSDIDTGGVMMSPAQADALWRIVKLEITPKDLKARLNTWLGGDGPIIFYRGDKPMEIDEANLREHMTLSSLMPPPKPAPFIKVEWPYANIGKDIGLPSAITAQDDDKVLGFTRLTYANGLKVNVKRTPYKTDQILIRVRFDGGTNRISPTEPVPAVFANVYDQNGILRAGMGKLSGTQVKDALNGKSYSINYRLSESYTDVNGFTTRDDVATQMQALMVFVLAPRFDEFAVRQAQTVYANNYKAILASPDGMIGNMWWGRVFPDDSRYAMPTAEAVNALSAADFTRFMKATLKLRRMEITVVGDISVEEAKAAINATFASLPAITDEPPLRFEPKLAMQKATDFTHQGKPGQAAAMVVWPTQGFYADIKRSRGLRLLSEVMTLRLNSILREKEGLAYSPYAYWSGSIAYDYGFLRVAAGINPAQEERFFKVLNQITDGLKTTPVTADELLRARKPIIESRLTDEKDNSFWLNTLSAAGFEPQMASAYKDFQAQMMSYEPQDLQLLAQSWLAADRAMTAVARPRVVATAPSLPPLPAMPPAAPAPASATETTPDLQPVP